jgi:phosphoserine/homoserine phosphotransferase
MRVSFCPDAFYQFAFRLQCANDSDALVQWLEIDQTSRIVNYHMRMQNQKQHSVAAFKSLNFHVLAAGDAYNDTAMLGEAHGVLLLSSDHLPKEFPQFPVTKTYGVASALRTGGKLQIARCFQAFFALLRKEG